MAYLLTLETIRKEFDFQGYGLSSELQIYYGVDQIEANELEKKDIERQIKEQTLTKFIQYIRARIKQSISMFGVVYIKCKKSTYKFT